MAGTSSRKILLKSSDGEDFEVDEIVALESLTIKHMIEDDSADNIIHLPDVTGKILSKVIEYCKKHVDAAAAKNADTTRTTSFGVAGDDELKEWDEEFVEVDPTTFFDLVAGDYLNIKNLMYLISQTVADKIKGKTPEEVRKTFNLTSSFPPEEEEILRENPWAFD